MLDTQLIYYVYILFDWLGCPRYVGKGKGTRWKHHERDSDHECNYLKIEFIKRTLRQLGEIPKIKVRENISEAEAYRTETAFIKALGRIDIGTGCLTNMNNGSDWPDASTRKWITDGKHNQRLHDSEELPEGWQYGRSYQNQESPEEISQRVSNFLWITNGQESSRINKDKPIPRGWRLGRTGTSTKNYLTITNGKKTKSIKPGQPIPKGWRRGRDARYGGVTSEYRWITNGNRNTMTKSKRVPRGWWYGKSGNKCWINNGVNNRKIERGTPLPEGWKFGSVGNGPKNQRGITNGLKNKMLHPNKPLPKGWRYGHMPKSSKAFSNKRQAR